MSSSFKISALTVFFYSGYMKVLFLVSSYEELWQSGPGNCVVNVENTSPFLDKILQIHNRKVERKSLRSLSSTLHLKNKFSLAVIAFISEEKGLGVI